MCVALFFSSCTKEALGTEANEPALQTTTLSSSITSTSDYSDLMIQLADEPEEGKVRKKDCTCYLKVINTINHNGLDWEFTEGLPPSSVFSISGVGNQWNPGTGLVNLPSSYFELGTPSQGSHVLNLAWPYYNPANPTTDFTLNVGIVCVTSQFELANYYNLDLVFSEGTPNLNFPNAVRDFDIYTSCNPNDGGNTGS